MKKILALCALALPLTLGLAGCDKVQSLNSKPQVFKNSDVTGMPFAGGFTLTDHTGKVRTLADFKGKVVAVFFGYTQCPDVCPTTMADMAAVLKALGPQAKDVQVLFITLDPERDTRELLSQYVPAFHPSFIGLYGDKAATDKVAKDFKVFYQKSFSKQPGSDPSSYTVDHQSAIYIFDKQGNVRLYARHGQGLDPIVHDIKLLLN